MRALSIKQPWAEFILQGRKSIETRLWKNVPRIEYPEEIAIHTGMVIDVHARHWFLMHGKSIQYLEVPLDYTTGAILGLVTLTGITVYSCKEAFDNDFESHLCQSPIPAEDYGNGPKVLGLRLQNVRRLLKPIPWKGALGFFDIGYSNWMDDRCFFTGGSA